MHAGILLVARRHAAALIALGTLGCAGPLDAPTGPSRSATGLAGPEAPATTAAGTFGPASQPGFYPLRVGNRWTYRLTATLRIVPDVGEPPPPLVFTSYQTRELDGVQPIGTREYLRERITSENGGFAYNAYYRQDAGGLYEFLPVRATPASSIATTGPARAARLDALLRPGAARPGMSFPETSEPFEAIRLRYPLAPKTRWVFRHPVGFDVTVEVVGVETLDLPAGRLRGYRIRLNAEVLAPNDRYELWYGPSGLLRVFSHYEFPATDLGGNIVGREIYENEELLIDLRLVGTEIVPLPPWLSPPAK